MKKNHDPTWTFLAFSFLNLLYFFLRSIRSETVFSLIGVLSSPNASEGPPQNKKSGIYLNFLGFFFVKLWTFFSHQICTRDKFTLDWHWFSTRTSYNFFLQNLTPPRILDVMLHLVIFQCFSKSVAFYITKKNEDEK